MALLLAFEWYLRATGFFEAQPAPYPCVQGDSKLNHVFRPGCSDTARAAALRTDRDVQYNVNSIGLRMPELRKTRQNLLVMGDSYTEGFGLSNDESFPAQLQRKIGGNWQAINGGILGFSPALYSLLYREKFASLSASHVLLNLDFSDLHDDVYYLGLADYNDRGEPFAFPGRELFSPVYANIVYQNKSALLRFFHQELNLWNQWKLAKKNRTQLERIVQREPRLIQQSWVDESDETRHCWKNYELTAKLVKQLQNEVEKSGAQMAIHMYVPGYWLKKMKLRPDSISFWKKWENMRRRDFSFSCGLSMPGVNVIRRFAESQGIPFFNSVDFLRNHPLKETLYFDGDAHWNKEGVKVVTEFLAPKLEKDFLKLSAKHGKRSGQ